MNRPSQKSRCAVAVVASKEVSGRAYRECLSEREQARYAAIGHPERKARWLAGRLAVKYLFLMQMNRAAGTMEAGPPVLVPLSAERVTAFLPWMYRDVEVLPPEAGGAPRLAWGGEPCPAHHVSIAHANGTTSACVAGGRRLGIDLEEAVHRMQVFYQGNFTAREQDWATRTARETGLAPDWLFTLLWTLKEAVLKSNVLEQPLSVWDFPRLDVQVMADPRCLAAAATPARLGDRFLVAGARITAPGRRVDVRIGMTATRKLILTVLNT